MTLTPEQIAEGWIEWSGGECPIKDDQTAYELKLSTGTLTGRQTCANIWNWRRDWLNVYIIAYRIIEAHGADAEPVWRRPSTPFPQSYDDLSFDADGWSQTIIVDGKRPEWLWDDDGCKLFTQSNTPFKAERFDSNGEHYLAIRVRRREPKRETVEARLLFSNGSPFNDQRRGTIDLIDGKPDPSTLKIGGEA